MLYNLVNLSGALISVVGHLFVFVLALLFLVLFPKILDCYVNMLFSLKELVARVGLIMTFVVAIVSTALLIAASLLSTITLMSFFY